MKGFVDERFIRPVVRPISRISEWTSFFVRDGIQAAANEAQVKRTTAGVESGRGWMPAGKESGWKTGGGRRRSKSAGCADRRGQRIKGILVVIVVVVVMIVVSVYQREERETDARWIQEEKDEAGWWGGC